MLLLGEKRRTVAQSPVGVEKLFPAKFAKIKSCQDAPQTTFSVFLDIFYPPNSCCFEENGVFQQPRLITTITEENVPPPQNSRRRRSVTERLSRNERAAPTQDSCL